MKTPLLLGTAFGILLLAGTAGAAAAPVAYKATLSGASEIPPNQSAGTGTAELSYDDGTKALTGTVTYSGLSGDVAQGHVHSDWCSPTGGPVEQPLVATGASLASPITINLTLTDTQATDLAAGTLYINLHTASFGNGEVRGEIVPADGAAPTPCATDAGTTPDDAGSSGTTSGGTSGSDTTSGGTSGTDAGAAAPASSSSSGCSTTGSSPGSALALALGVGLVAAAMRRKKK